MKLNLDRIVLRKYFENSPDLDYNLYLTILKFSQNITELFFLKTAANPFSSGFSFPSALKCLSVFFHFFLLLSLGNMNKVSHFHRKSFETKILNFSLCFL